MVKKVEKWFKPSPRATNWDKDDPPVTRRRNVLKSRWGSYLKAGRAMLALANVNSGPKGDSETERKARADAEYFFRMHRQKRKR